MSPTVTLLSDPQLIKYLSGTLYPSDGNSSDENGRRKTSIRHRKCWILWSIAIAMEKWCSEGLSFGCDDCSFWNYGMGTWINKAWDSNERKTEAQVKSSTLIFLLLSCCFLFSFLCFFNSWFIHYGRSGTIWGMQMKIEKSCLL